MGRRRKWYSVYSTLHFETRLHLHDDDDKVHYLWMDRTRAHWLLEGLRCCSVGPATGRPWTNPTLQLQGDKAGCATISFWSYPNIVSFDFNREEIEDLIGALERALGIEEQEVST